MKEDILEQAVDDWLLSQSGTFTKHNIKFRPDKEDEDFSLRDDSSHSDIDILAVNLKEEGVKRVSAVSCKSWQGGFNPSYWMDNLINNPDKRIGAKPAWKTMRELVVRKWGKALAQKVFEETGSTDYTYYIAVTLLKGNDIDKAIKAFENNEMFQSSLRLNKNSKVLIKIISFKEIFREYEGRTSHTLEATELGRLIQIIKASGVELKK